MRSFTPASTCGRLILPSHKVGAAERRSASPSFRTDSKSRAAIFCRAVTTDSGDNRAAYTHGFKVSRRYETADGRSLEAASIPLGSVVRVRVRLESGEARNYVAVDDKLPAGLEPLNTNLATTERVSLGAATPETTRGLEVLSFSETRDARVAFYADALPPGTYEWVYLARATTLGRFLRPPASAEAMYAPDVSGASAIDEVQVVQAAANGRRAGLKR